MSKIDIEHLSKIKGEQLSSVTFVMDYLQIDFDSNLLTCYKWPKVTVKTRVYSYGEVEYRNANCELIASNVLDVKSTEDRIWIEFELGSILFLMVDDSEVIYFTDSKKEWSYYPIREE